MPGHIGEAVLLVVELSIIFLASKIASRRKVKGTDLFDLGKIEGWIREASSMKRCIFFTTGTGSVDAPDTLAGLELLRYVAKACVQQNAQLIVANADMGVQQITEDIVKSSYTDSGRPNEYTPDSVRYLSGSVFAYAAGVMGLVRREKPAVNFFVGDFAAEALIIAEAGRSVAMHQFGGTSSVVEMPVFLATCDQTLIGSELYAAQSYLTGDVEATSQLFGEDAGKVVAVLLILIGVVLLSFGNSFLAALIGW